MFHGIVVMISSFTWPCLRGKLWVKQRSTLEHSHSCNAMPSVAESEVFGPACPLEVNNERPAQRECLALSCTCATLEENTEKKL